MKDKRKSIDFINSICAARTQYLVGEQRLIRMADADSLAAAFDMLRESGFSGEINLPFNQYESVIDNEEIALGQFVKEYAPSDEIECYCLAPYDFYNAEVLLKCAKLGLPCENFVRTTGLFSIEQLTELINGRANEKSFPIELVKAVKLACEELENKGGGMVVGAIFASAKYEYLKRIVKTGYLKEIIVKEIDGLNVCSAIRAGDGEVAVSQYIAGGSLTKADVSVIAMRDKKQVELLLSGSWIKEIALQAIDLAVSGKPLIETERTLNSLSAKRMIDGRYTENGGTYPFMLYYFKRRNEIACVRTVLTGKANGLLADEIKRRLITV